MEKREEEKKMPRLRVGVVGTGISGLSTAWALAKQGFEVSVFEKSDVLGGHALTYPGEGKRPDVDLGFQVFNLTTYPYLTQFFKELGVDHEPSDMSFSLSVDEGRTEWASHGLGSVFAQKKNLMSASFMTMMREVVRFGKEAPLVLKGKEFENTTLGEYLSENGYSKRFKDEYLLPTTAAVWSVPNSQMEDFPVVPLVAFMANHHLLDPLGARPKWRVVKDRSHQYVKAVEKALGALGAKILLNHGVKTVRETESGKMEVTSECEKIYEFDHVVLACHSNTAAEMLVGEGVEPHRKLVSQIRYQPNKVILHSDEVAMPKIKSAWASWNVLDKRAGVSDDEAGKRNICVTYWLNLLQNLPEDAPTLLCTLNPIYELDPSKVVFETTLDHPVFDRAAMAAQREINELQAMSTRETRKVWFAGAYLGSGFHEDGIRSAVAIATALGSEDGVTIPLWARDAGAPEEKPGVNLVRGPHPGSSMTQRVGLSVFQAVANRGFKKGHLRMILPDGDEMLFGRESAHDARLHGEPAVTLYVKDLRMLSITVTDSDIGLGTAYKNGWFTTDDLTGFFRLIIANNESLRKVLNPLGVSMDNPILSLIAGCGYAATNVVRGLQHRILNKNTAAGSRKNIEVHYDLGNGCYKLFLDESMTYSCGVHTEACGAKTLKPGQKELPLYESQLEKLDAIIRRADIKSTDTVLEIGCGWGSFAIRAASTVGCRVLGITISTEQLAEAKERVKAAGLEDKVDLFICDYRKLGRLEVLDDAKSEKSKMVGDSKSYHYGLAPGYFDKIVSIEMLEAVGHEHLPEYFETVERMLKPGGRATIQVISIPDDRYEEYCSTSDFIRHYIFPGGHLPCHSAIKWATEETYLDLVESFDIGLDYVITLREWRKRFLGNKEEILKLGYPVSWFNLFDMYFAYCEAGFEEKYIHDYHYTFVKRTPENMPKIQQGYVGTTADPNKTTKSVSVDKGHGLSSPSMILSMVVAFMAWAGTFSMAITPAAHHVISAIFFATFFVGFQSFLLPSFNLSFGLESKRARRRLEVQMVKFFISALVCSLVIGLVAFHEILYTTKVANTVVSSTGGHNNSSETPIHFCGVAFNESENVPGCDSGSTTEASGMVFIKSPLHFVASALAWASISRLLLDHRNWLNALHTIALLGLLMLAFSSDLPTASSALGLMIVHGISELSACISSARKIFAIQGFTYSHGFYRKLWTVDMSALLLIRWVPVPFLLYPVLLKAPFPVPILIGFIALRETAVLISSVLKLREDIENRVNTDKLLVHSRSRDELIKSMVDAHAGTATKKLSEQQGRIAAKVSDKTTKTSCIMEGVVTHQRKKVDGVIPKSHFFKYNVWMALIDLQEVESGSAFSDNIFVSIEGPNVFSWYRCDHFDNESGLTLSQSVRELVKERTGKSTEGKIQLVTNLRCFGYVFNPVSIYYCFSKVCETKLDAVVLEVSNTPWLEKRLYVLPFWDQIPQKEHYRCKWEKDFHVSPFFDVFYNYEWHLTIPKPERLHVKAVSTRRMEESQAADLNGDWTHQTGAAPTNFVNDDGKADDPVSFVAGLTLKQSTSPVAQLLKHPFQTFCVVFYIHVQAGILMIKKSADFKLKPSNSPVLGIAKLPAHLAVFAVASLYEIIRFPFKLASKLVAKIM